MNYAWMCPIPLEKAIARRADMVGMFSVAGDSMLFVDKRGHRVVNEKLPYNELAQKFVEWDATAGEYPYLVLVQVWDQRSQDHSISDGYGRLIVAPGEDDAHVIRGETLAELSVAIGERLVRYAGVTGGLALDDDFAASLQASVARFNELALTGVDSTSAADSAPSSNCSTATFARSPVGRTRRCGRSATAGHTTPRS